MNFKEKIKREAAERSNLAMCFALPTRSGRELLGLHAENIMRLSFSSGAEFGFRLAVEKLRGDGLEGIADELENQWGKVNSPLYFNT